MTTFKRVEEYTIACPTGDGGPIVKNGKQSTGYPTQKPLALYERIIRASSNEGDLVLDPFAGCATTAVAAERLNRLWVAIDINAEAEDVIHGRLVREVNDNMAWANMVTVAALPPRRTDDGAPAAPELMLVGRKRRAARLPLREVRGRLIAGEGRRCQGCGWTPPYDDYLQVDHKMPRSLGGGDEMENLTLLCDPCNRLKSNKLTLHELRLQRSEEGRMDTEWWQYERWR